MVKKVLRSILLLIQKITRWNKAERLRSSYADNNVGASIRDVVKRHHPKTVVEFGVHCGYSTIHIARALSEGGRVFAYDLWNEAVTMEEAQKNIKRHGASDKVTVGKMDFYEWLKNPSHFDLMHLDIHNTGEILRAAVNSLRPQIESGSVILFEGGTEERDRVDWMVKDNKEPMFPLKNIIGYEIVDSHFPGLSIITGDTLKHTKYLESTPYRSPFALFHAMTHRFENKNVYDLGCGSGDLMLYLRDVIHCKSVRGINDNDRHKV